MYLENIFVGLTILYPIAWILILNGRYEILIKDDVRKFIIYEVFMVALLVATFLAPLEIPRVSSYLEIYIVFFGLFPLLFRKKIGIHYLPMLFCASALTVFVASEIWEYPIFIYGTLKIFHVSFQSWSGNWFDHIHRIYAVVIFWFLLRSTNWKSNFRSVGFMILSFILPFLLLSPLFFNVWSSPVLVRVSTLVLFGFAIYFGLDIEEYTILINKGEKLKDS